MNRLTKRFKTKVKNAIRFYIKHGSRPLGMLVGTVCPFVSVLFCYNFKSLYLSLLLSFIMISISVFLKVFADIVNAGKDIPIPYKRFTKDDEYDGVTVSKSDLDGMIVYMNDLENWLESQGLVDSRRV